MLILGIGRLWYVLGRGKKVWFKKRMQATSITHVSVLKKNYVKTSTADVIRRSG